MIKAIGFDRHHVGPGTDEIERSCKQEAYRTSLKCVFLFAYLVNTLLVLVKGRVVNKSPKKERCGEMLVLVSNRLCPCVGYIRKQVRRVIIILCKQR